MNGRVTKPMNNVDRSQLSIDSKSRIEMFGVFILVIAASCVYFWTYYNDPYRPNTLGHPSWWTWFDQERYYNAAIAWSHWNLDPGQHWYLPGYPLLGAVFALTIPLHPFMLPDLLGLILSLVIFGYIARHLVPEIRYIRLLGSGVFFISSVCWPLSLTVWVTPWSTSGSAPLIYASMLSAIIYIQNPNRPLWAFLAMLAAVAVLGFRPSDAATVLAGCGSAMIIAWYTRCPSTSVRLKVVGAAFLGGGVSFTGLLIVHLSIYGWHESSYMFGSAQIGAEWRLIPLRWVMLIIDPRPLLPSGNGIVATFPWVAPGMFGFAAALWCSNNSTHRTAHLAVIATVILTTLSYLAYRDLHPGGLFQFWNYHYFKAILPILCGYAVYAVWLVWNSKRRWGGIAAGLLVLLATMPWRVEIQPAGELADVAESVTTLKFRPSLTQLEDAVMVGADGAWGDVYFGPHDLDVNGRSYGSFADFRLYPEPGGFLLLPLRPLASGQATLTVSAKVKIRVDTPPVAVKQHIVFGLPCWMNSNRPACQPSTLIPPPLLAGNTALKLDQNASAYLTSGWSIAEDRGRWTDGYVTNLRFRIPEQDRGHNIKLMIHATPFLPAGTDSLDVDFEVNAKTLSWQSIKNSQDEFDVDVPTTLIPASGIVDLTLHIRNPHYPSAEDRRLLGLYVLSVTWEEM